jgi:tetratricopeptide (TPR) repeat protein/predicted Ser/Thr protein kinase
VTLDVLEADAQRARRARELFEAAVERDAASRGAFLDAECAGDPALRADVEKLLRSAHDTTQLVGDSAETDDGEAAAQLNRGQTVGRFVVLGLLGRGGMGEVYGAYDPELDRKVAVKLVRPRISRSRDDRGRLLREAQAIAKLSHPNVVVIYDVGTVDERVFIAMEFVEGNTLGTWLRASPRSRREIIDVFCLAARGLAAAHQAGLVHRDFKPDNVMVGADGQVRVMDFGLARHVLGDEEPLPDPVMSSSSRYLHAKVTQTGALLGSPAYMAPEQFLGTKTDGRTDQFAFCVALYEALYGERPFGGETVLALQVNVLEGRLRPAPVRSRVPSWIRRILLRGLAIDPAGRFSSMQALLSALGNDPARRTRKWLLIASAPLALLAVAGLTRRLGAEHRRMCAGGGANFAGIWESGGADSARKEAIRRAFAASGKSYAEQAYAGVSRLMDQYVSRWTGMYQDACEATNLRGEQSAEVLDLRMDCLHDRLGNVRTLSDVFAAADGQVVENAVSAAAALPSLDRCADVRLLRAVIKPPEDPTTRKRVDDLRGELARLTALRDSGQCTRALAKADGLVGEVRAVGYKPLLADTLYAAGQIDCGDTAKMLLRLKEAHAAATASRSDDVAAQAAGLIPPLAVNRLDQVTVAREWLVVAQGDVERVGRETFADALLAQAEGMLAATDKDYGRALSAADRSIAVARRLLGADDPWTIQLEANKGDWEESAGRLNDALKTDTEAIGHFERVLGRDHPRIAMTASNQGEVLNLLGRYREAELSYRRAAHVWRESGADPTFIGWALTGLGRALLGQDLPGPAVAPLEEALKIRTQKQAPPTQMGETRFALARALWSDPLQQQRALTLAVAARGEYAGDLKTVSEIQEWLANHALPVRIVKR